MTHHRLGVLTAVSLFALSASFGAALAAGEPDPPVRNPPVPQQNQKSTPSGTKDSAKKKNQQKSEQEFRDGYRAAYALVQAGQYQAASSATRRASSATMRPRNTGTSARSLPTRTTCAPGSITACGMSSRATCSKPQTSWSGSA